MVASWRHAAALVAALVALVAALVALVAALVAPAPLSPALAGTGGHTAAASTAWRVKADGKYSPAASIRAACATAAWVGEVHAR